MTEAGPTLFLFAGLGNPGRRFRLNRHNIGFMVVDAVARQIGVSFTRHQAQALLTDGQWEGARVYLAKPQTFMNLVGSSVGPLARYYRIPPSSVVVVYDDLDLPLGSLRLRGGGGSGGHRGMESLIGALGDSFPRLRLGIDTRAKIPPISSWRISARTRPRRRRRRSPAPPIACAI
jgi:PTH1 family peptidyl-tRNA hydrolase